MGDIFSGLESLGFAGLSGVKIYDEEKKEQAKSNEEKKEEKVINESDFLFDKKLTCPVCDKEFKTKTVKTGKPRLIGSDPDLRPKYLGIDSIKYDAIVCPNCGYAALSRYFSYMTSAQAKLIKDNVSSSFKGLPPSGEIYSYDEAIARHKLALLNTVVKKAKNSERAYTCLKIAWLFRGKQENVPDNFPNKEKAIESWKEAERDMVNNAFSGFKVAMEKEDFPICGMDEATFTYMLAVLADKVGAEEDCAKLISQLLVSHTANPRIKDKARFLRDEIKARKTQ